MIAHLAILLLLGADQAVQLKEARVELNGVFWGETSTNVWLTVQKQFEQVISLQPGQTRDGIGLDSVLLHPVEVRVRVGKEAASLGLTAPVAFEAHAEANLVCSNLPITEILQFYSAVTGRTVIRQTVEGRAVDRFSLTFSGTRREGATMLQQVLAEGGLVLTNYQEKFAIVVQKAAFPLALPREKMDLRVKDGNEILPAGSFVVEGMPFQQLVQLYEIYSGTRVTPAPGIRPLWSHSLRQASELTRAELVHAMEVLFRVNGYKMERADDGVLKIDR